MRVGLAAGLIAAKFHNTLVEMMVRVARECGEEKIVLSGGCFQNRYLTERAVKRLREEGFGHTGTSGFLPTTAGLRWARWLLWRGRIRDPRQERGDRYVPSGSGKDTEHQR